MAANDVQKSAEVATVGEYYPADLKEEAIGNSVEVTSSGSKSQEAPVGGSTVQDTASETNVAAAIEELESKKSWFSYFRTREFYIVLVMGQVLALCITGTNTCSQKLSDAGTSIPAFQTLFNYVLLTLIYTSYTIYSYGIKKYAKLMLHDGWKYFILSFLDVEGNYFTVLAYRYTTLLSAQLLNFWSIVCVVLISFLVLKVRYKWTQVAGILICCGGMGVLLASDHISGASGGPVPNELKGDLFALAGATFYGLCNVAEEWIVSKRPMYEVLGMLGVFGILINGVQSAIFDRGQFKTAVWTPEVGGYLTGYTLIMTIFYSLVPITLRLASAAFLNISLLTGNFWGTIIGIKVFGYSIHWMYPIAFVCIILGQVVYFLAGSMLGDSFKPWLGLGQENGVAGVGTAKRKALKRATHRSEDVESTEYA
jgi:solute carrier family 35 protein F1/2